MIEAAAFLICLDETSPTHAEGRIQDMMMLEGFNRWVDKSLAFVICKNATSGTYVEHTMIDVSLTPTKLSLEIILPYSFFVKYRVRFLVVYRSKADVVKALTLIRLQTTICEGILAYKPTKQANGHSNGQIKVSKEFVIRTTPEIEERILEIRQRFKDDVSKFGYRDIILPQFGTQALLGRGLPIKGIFDVMCQLANFYFYGYSAQSWEAISMSHYHKGRPDIVQVVTPVTAQFCSAADDENLPLSTRFQLMVDAAYDHNTTIKNAFTGQCYQRTLRALELVRRDGEDTPSLFKNPLYERTVEPDQMFSNTDGLSPESCFIMQDPSKFWMTYYVTDAG
jgi:hypothetical protein